jgi:hypothetical protein
MFILVGLALELIALTAATAIRLSRHCQDEVHGAIFTIEHLRAVAMRQATDRGRPRLPSMGLRGRECDV